MQEKETKLLLDSSRAAREGWLGHLHGHCQSEQVMEREEMDFGTGAPCKLSAKHPSMYQPLWGKD